VQWTDLDEAIELARRTNKPILYDFTADWCTPCHVLDAEVFRDAELAAVINDRFIPVRIVDRQREEGRNTPRIEDLQRRYSVRGFPTVVIAEGAGAERARMEGFRGRDEFERLMESVR
jgi:thiol:disulfide interchange protein